MAAPIFGMQFSRPLDEPIPVSGASFAKAWIIETSADADAAVFPIGTPVRFSTTDTAFTSKLGTGYLADAVKAINAQLIGLNAGADIVVTRVLEGTGTVPVALAATSVNIVAALATAASLPSQVNMTPRLIWAGRTGWRADAVTTNPVVAALPAACAALLAIAVVDVSDTSTADAISARNTMNSQRLLPVGSAARVYEGSNVVTRPMGPRVIGLIMRVDNENEGLPFDPFANRPLYGLVGTSRKIPFSLLDGSTEGQQLLDAEVSIVVAGETNVDGAPGEGGFVYIGTDNTETGELWKQIHQVRASDYLTVKLMQITRQFLGQKITGGVTEAWLNSIKFMLRDHKAAEDILGYEVTFRPDRNSPEQIRLGNLTVNLGIEPAPVFKVATHEIRRYRPAVEGLVADIIARMNAVG